MKKQSFSPTLFIRETIRFWLNKIKSIAARFTSNLGTDLETSQGKYDSLFRGIFFLISNSLSDSPMLGNPMTSKQNSPLDFIVPNVRISMLSF